VEGVKEFMGLKSEFSLGLRKDNLNCMMQLGSE